MGRRIIDPDAATATQPTASEEAKQETKAGKSKDSATFICNFINQKIKFDDGTEFVVTQSRFEVTGAKLIENLRSKAEQAHLMEQ